MQLVLSPEDGAPSEKEYEVRSAVTKYEEGVYLGHQPFCQWTQLNRPKESRKKETIESKKKKNTNKWKKKETGQLKIAAKDSEIKRPMGVVSSKRGKRKGKTAKN